MSIRTQMLIETLCWVLFAVTIIAAINLCTPDPVHSARAHNHKLLTEGEQQWK